MGIRPAAPAVVSMLLVLFVVMMVNNGDVDAVCNMAVAFSGILN